MKGFEQINTGFNSVFKVDCLSIGMVVPIENYAQSSIPKMEDHLTRVQLVEQLGFKALWVRDVPLHVPSFGDAGQTFDPFTYLGYLAGQTTDIALGVASVALPLHHPLHVAKSAASVDQLSNGRLILGVASGDRPAEYPAMGIDFERRGVLFREALSYLEVGTDHYPTFPANSYGELNGQVDILPKAAGHKIPILITGNSRQSIDWIADHGDGWMYYPRNILDQGMMIQRWRRLLSDRQLPNKPFMQPLYVILEDDDDFKPSPIQLGFRIGIHYLIEYLYQIQEIGVNHIALNLRFNSRNMEETLEHLAKNVLPKFHQTAHKEIQL